MQQDERGHAMTSDSADAAAALDLAIHNFLHWRAAVIPPLRNSLETDPDFGFAHIVSGLILHGARNIHFRPKIAAAIASAEETTTAMTPREQLYLAALKAAFQGDISGSVALYETILVQHPLDLFAQRLAQMELFWIGEMEWSADISARVAPAWSEAVPSYGIHLSCRAFDLEESGDYRGAEKLARQAVEIDPSDVWGTHAMAHVMIMENRIDEGIAWLDGLKDHWGEANQMALHLWWHRCLFHLEHGEFEAVIDIYDNWIRNRELPLLKSMADLYIDMQNGASMLQRLEMCKVPVGDRWEELLQLTLNRLEDHTSPFTSPHYALILAASGRFEESYGLLASMEAFAATDKGTLGPRYRAAAIPAARGAIAFRQAQYEDVVAALFPARRSLWQMGGSHAQRDVFTQMLVFALGRLGQADLLAIVVDDAKAFGFSDVPERLCYRQAAALLQ
ncbi:tetratricopeptide repeat protein [Limibacillus halophilus]|uniref:Tetratricopeptide repeat protein 38 n=1 Tax=Limibacillus halophilus TaxID=1579333 RepID=A0A839SX63_9PROT|nr:tetratricopeptide repeat protein [Limibacillus halophilus]MBB3066270.1 tetratricopeptide (TPR) repeat protein [Limibacillus halophilus]